MKRKAECFALVLTFLVAGNAIGQVSAVQVSEGQFGSTTGGGTYSFPGNVGIGTTTPANKLNIIANAGGILNLQTAAGLRIDDSWTPSIAMMLGVDAVTNVAVVQTSQPGYSWVTKNLALQPLGGNVGLGTATPANKFNIVADAGGVLNLQNSAALRIDDASASPSVAILAGVDSGTSTGVLQTVQPGVSWDTRHLALQPNGGRLGIGTVSPSATLHVFGRAAAAANTVSKLENAADAKAAFFSAKNNTDRVIQSGMFGSSADGTTFGVSNINAAFFYTTTEATNHPSALLIGTHGAAPVVFGTDGLERARIDPSGHMTIKGHLVVTGNITGAQVINATFQDLAEWVPATTDMPPGTLVVLNPSRENEVMISSRAYDSTVAGVVSEQPGILLGIAGDSKEQIATTGRVRVRVDATSAPIRIGDLLVTSNTPGMAMRSEPIDVHGRLIHQPGTIIGKALQPLEGGVGDILVLLSLQ